MRIFVLVLYVLFSGLVQMHAQGAINLVGYYLPLRTAQDVFPQLSELELWKDSATAPYRGSILIDVTAGDSSVSCVFREILLDGKFLTFTADECAGARYEFRGEFLRLEKEDPYNDEVLRGELSVFIDGVLIKKGIVGFEFSEGC